MRGGQGGAWEARNSWHREEEEEGKKEGKEEGVDEGENEEGKKDWVARGNRQEARIKRQEVRGKRQEAKGKRQEARGKRQEARAPPRTPPHSCASARRTGSTAHKTSTAFECKCV
jgi:hypothetical protein